MAHQNAANSSDDPDDISIVEDFRSFLIAHLPQIQLVVITKFSIALIIRLAKM